MESENEIDFMGYKAMCHCRPNIQRAHNLRDPKIVSSEKHIDPTRLHETILDMGTLEEAYHKIFDKAVADYNAKQKRKDRRIDNYLETILNDKRKGKHKNLKADGSRKPAYEMIIQIGNRDNCPDDETAKKILKDFCEFIPQHYQNIVPIGIYLHGDEFSIDEESGQKINSPMHIHFDFVYVAHLGRGVKTGMVLQSSLSGALREMGFITRKGGTAQQQFEEAVRHDLQDFAEARGLKIDRTPGERHKHKEKPVYQLMMANRKKQERLIIQESKLSQKENDLNRDKQLFDTSKTKVDTYLQIRNDVKKNCISIDSEIQAFKNDRQKDFATRFNTFVANVKKIVTSITTELNFYKAAFERFWHKRSQDFRILADIMDRNRCKDFNEYNRKFHNGLLDYQIAHKQKIQEQHAIRKKELDDAFEMDL